MMEMMENDGILWVWFIGGNPRMRSEMVYTPKIYKDMAPRPVD